jgi:hypothetical protein
LRVILQLGAYDADSVVLLVPAGIHYETAIIVQRMKHGFLPWHHVKGVDLVSTQVQPDVRAEWDMGAWTNTSIIPLLRRRRHIFGRNASHHQE